MGKPKGNVSKKREKKNVLKKVVKNSASKSKKQRFISKTRKTSLETNLSKCTHYELDEYSTQLLKPLPLSQWQGAVEGRGVIYLKQIPYGFFEDQMKGFFSQFGEVTRLRLARSQKTGNSLGYAYVEFSNEAVAKIVAETMNNYLMFEKLLKCKFLPNEMVNPGMFRDLTAYSLRKTQLNRESLNWKKLPSAIKLQRHHCLSKLDKLQRKLDSLDVDFDVEQVVDGLNRKAVMVVDPEEKDIIFKTPPGVRKVTLKTESSKIIEKKEDSESDKINDKVDVKSRTSKKLKTCGNILTVKKRPKTTLNSLNTVAFRAIRKAKLLRRTQNTNLTPKVKKNKSNAAEETGVSPGGTELLLRNKPSKTMPNLKLDLESVPGMTPVIKNNKKTKKHKGRYYTADDNPIDVLQDDSKVTFKRTKKKKPKLVKEKIPMHETFQRVLKKVSTGKVNTEEFEGKVEPPFKPRLKKSKNKKGKQSLI